MWMIAVLITSSQSSTTRLLLQMSEAIIDLTWTPCAQEQACELYSIVVHGQSCVKHHHSTDHLTHLSILKSHSKQTLHWCCLHSNKLFVCKHAKF
ncbi:hypothetical protein FB192DRAFT_1372231 [Mucor lusitanicus]|uniref:Uncharacterized protein n=1 Tax=Mucor circinelloides f. lusitanicus TaxID=29924 RepID=A0A8H4BL12_MUCCL|nr:hypothetical protein FB192DRAFT_1372231 [Mucor lusitanicus]